MNLPIFIHYSRTRNPEYQVETTILPGKQCFVEKRALTKTACKHLENAAINYKKIAGKSLSDNIKYAKLVSWNKNHLITEYAEGTGLSILLFRAFKESDESRIVSLLKEYKFVVTQSQAKAKFVSTQEFCEYFGKENAKKILKDEICFFPANTDLNPGNIIVNGSQYVIIDYEWIIDAYVPVQYMMWAGIYTIYSLNGFNYMDKIYPFKESMRILGIKKEKNEIFKMMKDSFLSRVFGNGSLLFIKERYNKKSKTASNFHNHLLLFDEKKKQDETIKHLEAQIKLVENSISWKLTAPLRRGKAIIVGNNKIMKTNMK